MGSAIPKHKIRRPAIQTVHRVVLFGDHADRFGSDAASGRFGRYQFFIHPGRLNALVLSVVMDRVEVPVCTAERRMKGGVFSEPEHPV